jgi:hypothetical protein
MVPQIAQALKGDLGRAGDTGLIDYCIANWFEKVVEEDTGCILRRQICSTTGKMVFWLQCSPAEGPSSDTGNLSTLALIMFAYTASQCYRIAFVWACASAAIAMLSSCYHCCNGDTVIMLQC